MATPEFERRFDFAAFVLFCIAGPAAHFAIGVVSAPETVFLSEVAIFFLPATAFLLYHRAPGIFSLRCGFVRTGLVFLSALAVSSVLNFSLPYWLEIFPMPPGYERTFLDMLHLGTFTGFLRDISFLGLVPALSEEAFFRGVMQTGLCAKFKPRTAVLIAALAFAGCHLNPWYFPFYFALGVFFGTVFLQTGRLWLSVLAHFVNNALGVILYHYF